MPEETYGRYQLLRKIASGGMAEIFLARPLDGPPDRPVVVKRILPHLAANADFIQMFLNEARISVHLNHPNIVQTYDLGEAEGTYFIAMEYIHGEDLRRVWKQAEQCHRAVSIALVCRIVVEACRALQYAHEKKDGTGKPLGIVHRDISPQNILLTFEGGVKLVDFGIAKAALQSASTRSGVLKGKYSYMSPEQAQGKRLDKRSDIFALGIILYELVTGTRLFKRGNDLQTLNAVINCEVNPPSLANPKLPSDLDTIVLTALERNPDDRYAEARELRRALEDWLLAHGLSAGVDDLGGLMREIYAERLAQTGEPGALSPAGQTSGKAPGLYPKNLEQELRALLPSEPPPLRPPPRPPLSWGNTPVTEDEAKATSAVATSSAEYSEVSFLPSLPEPSAASLSAPGARLPPSAHSSQSGTSRQGGAGAAARLKSHAAAFGARLRRRLTRRVIAAGVSAALLLGMGLFAWRYWPTPPPAASVWIASEPEGATLLFDGSVRLKTPARLPEVPAKTYAIQLSLPGYETKTGRVHVPATGDVRLPAVQLKRLPVP